MGGGMNIALSPRIALRAVQANWLRTQLPNATTNVQNNLDLGAGVVVRFWSGPINTHASGGILGIHEIALA
jgi:hypothetical protein